MRLKTETATACLFYSYNDDGRMKKTKYTLIAVTTLALLIPAISNASASHDCEHTAALWANIQKARQETHQSYDELMNSYIEGYVRDHGKAKGLASPSTVAMAAHNIYEHSINITPQEEFDQVYKECKIQHQDIINQWVKH